MAGLGSHPIGSQIPDPDARKTIGKLFMLGGKLAPVAERIDFFESSSSSTTFDGRAWRSRSVTHYAAPVTSSDSRDDRVGAVSDD